MSQNRDPDYPEPAQRPVLHPELLGDVAAGLASRSLPGMRL